MKRIFFLLLIVPFFLLNSCKKEDKAPDYGELPVLEDTKWIKRMKDDFDRMTTQTLSFGDSGKGWFQTTDYVMYDGYTIKGFREETVWTLKEDVIYVHFSRVESMYFPEKMYGTYKWDEDGNPILSFGGEVYRPF